MRREDVPDAVRLQVVDDTLQAGPLAHAVIGPVPEVGITAELQLR